MCLCGGSLFAGLCGFMCVCNLVSDEVAEWLRRWTANPLGSARVGSNPIFVVDFIFALLIT